MKLTRSFDIGVQVLLQLAAQKNQLSTAELAQKVKAPRNHIAKVVQVLTRGGYIRTRRGKGGGTHLARDLEEISVQDIIDIVEGPLYLMECTINAGVCPLSPRCRMRLKIREAQEGMMKVFRNTKLNELLPGGQRKSSLKTKKQSWIP